MASSPTNKPKSKAPSEGICGLFFLRNVLTIFNIIFWLSGLAFLAIGIWTYITKYAYISLLSSSTFAATTCLFLATGGVIIIIGVIGCVGVWKDNRGCLIIYAFCLLVIFLLEAIAGVLAYMYEGAIREELSRSLNHTMREHYMVDMKKTVAIDQLEKEFHCCGAADFQDWEGCEWLLSSNSSNKVPDSCCISPSPECGDRDHPSNIYDMGCIDALAEFLRQHLIIIGGIGLGLCCLQVFGIIFACCLARKIKDYRLKPVERY